MSILLNKNQTKNPCKGWVFRYTENCYIGNNGELVVRKSARPLKRKSCDGSCSPFGSRTVCDTEWMPDWLHEDVNNGSLPHFPEGVRSGDLIILKYLSSVGSYEYPDELDIELYFEILKEDL